MTDISALEGYAGQLSEAAAQAKAASAKQAQYVEGGAHLDVETEGGMVPTLAKQARLADEKIDAALIDVAARMAGAMVFDSTAAGLAAVPANGYFSVPSASSAEYLVLYKKEGGAAVEKSRYPSAMAVKALQDDPQRPRAQTVINLVEALFAGIFDEDGNGCWLQARASDGGPTEWAMTLLRARLGTLLKSYPGMLFAVVDADDNLTDWALRDTDGQVPDWIIERWAGRMAPLLVELLGLNVPKEPDIILPQVRGSTSAILGTDTYLRDGELLPMLPNMQQWAGWGSSTIAQFAEMTALAAEFGATYYNGGQGSEWSTHGAARLGSIPALLTVPTGSIPAEAGYVLPVTCSNVQGVSYFRSTVGYLNGVEGTLKGIVGGFTFTRAVAGQVVTVTGQMPFVPKDGPLQRAAVTFLNLGKNNVQSGQPAEEVIKHTDLSFAWLAPFVKRVIVMGQFVNVGTPAGSLIATRLAAINKHCAQRYGRQFFDLGGYLTDVQIWADTGVTPTAADLEQQAIGNLPPSLATSDGAHMLPVARAAVALKLKAMVQSLGWY
ncbi:hypothetical protein [Pseudomonas asiatica]|uniref:hypothetical protein n=1 Tax=Pseudomonas asiatica TaxID=2219225 RepID=UPI0018A9DCEC|nr:hypothetical protein [Pseudomonas asiatica]MBF8802205.1 hypothetical protein [Pseudomonas asiatica]